MESRAGDKRTRTADIHHRINHRLSGLPDWFYHRGQRETITPPRTQLTTFIVLCSPKSNSSQKVLTWNPISGILVVLDYLATREPGTESSPLFPPDSLVLRMIALLQPFLSNRSGQLMRSTPRIRVGIWSVYDPWMPLESLGRSRSSYEVETMGSVHGMAFPFTTFCSKGWREIVHQVVRKRQLDPLPQGS